MRILAKLSPWRRAAAFWHWSAPQRARHGLWSGLRLAWQMRSAQWAAPAGTPVRLSIPELAAPVWVRAGTSDVLVVGQLFEQRELDLGLARPPATIVDAGANIGLATALFASRYPSAEVISLEIDRDNFRLLERNVASYPNVRPVRVGLWSRRGRLAVQNPDANKWSFRVQEQSDGDIEAWDMEAVLAALGGRRVSLLKMDIEGAEHAVFADPDLGWLDHVDVVAVETHDRYSPGCSDVIRAVMSGAGFNERMVGEYHVFERDGSVDAGGR